MSNYNSRCVESIKSALASFARSEEGFINLSGSAPQLLPGTASFSIIRPNLDEFNSIMTAPAGVWLRATNFQGFAVSEPTTWETYHDPTQDEITYIWTLPDEGYVAARAPNIPNLWRSRTVAYGKQIAVVFTTPGVKVIQCFAFDRAGNFGTAEYVFGPEGQSAAIADPNVTFAGNRTILYSVEGVFPQEVLDQFPGCQTRTTSAAVTSALTSLNSAGVPYARVLLRRGETYTDIDGFSNGGSATGVGYHAGAYGTGPRPRIVCTTKKPPFGRTNAQRQMVISDMDLQGPWDASREIGRRIAGYNNNENYNRDTLWHRCKYDGFDRLVIALGDDSISRILHDTEVTNWKEYGITGNCVFHAVIACDIHQHEDALCGHNHGAGDNSPLSFGNIHGPQRSAGRTLNTFFDRNSYLARGAWSNSRTTNYNTAPPTAEQACIRFNTNTSTPTPAGNPVHTHVWTRNSFEGGYEGNVQLSGNGNTFNGTSNILIDKCLFVAGPMSGNFSGPGRHSYVTFRNCYGAVTNITRRGWNAGTVHMGGVGEGGKVYNNTIIDLRNDVEQPTAAFVVTGLNAQSANNLHYAPFRSVGVDFFPSGVSGVLDGFVCRHKGQRWGFPPIGIHNVAENDSRKVQTNLNFALKGPILVSSVREKPGEPGVLEAGDVLNGEWVIFDYPDYTGLCNNTGFPVTKEILLANSTQWHQVSVTDESSSSRRQLMVPATAGPNANGFVVFDLDTVPGKIRIQNTCGLTWGGTRRIGVLLDLSDYYMDFMPNSGHAGQTLSLPIPPAGPARITEVASPVARDDFFGNVRADRAVKTLGAFTVPN